MSAMRRVLSPIVAVVALAGGAVGPAQAQDRAALRSAESFAATTDARERSMAMFREAGRVIQHPRCVNCHPAGDIPLQGLDGRTHSPPVVRGVADMGAPGMLCTTCHGPINAVLPGTAGRSLPGNPAWHLAPIEMAWVGKSLGEICRQIKDPARNGGRTLAALHEHMAKDDLVGWGWNPGPGREPVPGTQEVFGRLIGAWIETGAECPS